MQRKTWVRVLVSLSVLFGLSIAVDRAAEWGVERSIENALVSQIAQSGANVSVSGAEINIHGFPFLTQIVSGRLSEVTGSVEHGTFGNYEVRDLHFAATGVQPNSPYTVESAQVNALIPFTTLSTLIDANTNGAMGITIGGYESGGLRLTGSLMGLELGLVARPSIVGPSTVELAVDQVLIGGLVVAKDDLPFGLGGSIQDFEFNLDLPSGTSLTDITVEPDGLRVYLTAQNVAFGQLVSG